MSAVNIPGTTIRATAYDDFFAAQTAQGACGLVLPAISNVANGWSVTVVDQQNNAGTNNITIATPDSTLINGQSSLVVSLSGGSVVLVKNNGGWSAAGEFTPTSQASANVAPYFSVQTVTTSTATISPSATLVLCNFAGSVSLALPATSNANVVFGRPVFVQNQTNTGNTSSVVITVTGNTSASLNAVSNGVLTISTAFGGVRLVPSSTGFWSF